MKKRGKRGQSSLEYILIVGFAFMITLPLVVIYYQRTVSFNQEITDSQVNKIADDIIGSVNSVYYLGSPSKKTIDVYMPQGIKDITITENRLVFLIYSDAGNYEIVRWAPTNISGNLSNYSGLHIIEVIASSQNVTISDGT
jgi:hypothetical protein